MFHESDFIGHHIWGRESQKEEEAKEIRRTKGTKGKILELQRCKTNLTLRHIFVNKFCLVLVDMCDQELIRVFGANRIVKEDKFIDHSILNDSFSG